jgi:hypothetical protein
VGYNGESMRPHWLEIETQGGPPITAGEATITPYAWVVRLRAPFGPLGFVWVWPAYVAVPRPGQPEQRLAVPNVTPVVTLGLLALTVIVGLRAWRLGRRTRH